VEVVLKGDAADLCTDEERHLVQFFGNEYLKYRERTPTRIPFVS
jgi:protein-S-isoprenylcysteine O-methyltransferase Ste14